MALFCLMWNKTFMIDKKNDALEKRLSALVEASPKSQNAIARELGIVERTFSNYVNGREPQDRKQQQQIADYFNVSVAYLLGYTDNPSPISSAPIQKPLTGTPNNGMAHSKEGSMADSELYRALMMLNTDMTAIRQELRYLADRVRSLETGGGKRPPKGRKAKS